MPTIDVQVAASEDDADQRESTGVMLLTDVYPRTKSYAENYGRYWSGFRYVLGEEIPQNSTIIAAYWEGWVFSTSYDDACFDIYLEKAAAPASFTTDAFNLTGRPRTDAFVEWVEDNINDGGDAYYGSDKDLKAVLQEVVDAHSITHVAVILKPKIAAEKKFYVFGYDEGSNPPKLHIEYEPPAAPEPVGTPGIIIRSFVSPDTQPTGLTFDDRTLWHADMGENLIYQIDPETGTVIRSFASPGDVPIGLAFDGRTLWHVDDDENLIYQINPETGRVIRSFAAPVDDAKGLTFDGRTLWNCDAGTDRIYQIDPETGTVIRSFAFTPLNPHGMTFDGRMLWVSSYEDGRIYQVDPVTGTLIQSFASGDTVPVGLAFDGRTLWCVQWTNNAIVQITL